MAKANHYAVVVGIDQYPDFLKGKKNLNCPQNDARAICDWLLRPDGGDLPVGSQPNESPNLKLITREVPHGRQPPCPLVDEILKAIKSSAATFHTKYNAMDDGSKAATWASSRLYLYLSGHGIDADGGDAVLLGANTGEGLLPYLSVQGIVNKFRVAKTFRELVVWTDCCRTASAVQIAPAPLDLTANYSEQSGDVQVFFARASKTQKLAYEPPPDKLKDMPNSFFTHALLEGLGGGVVGASQGIRTRNLRPYLELRVPELSRSCYQVEQAPDIAPDDDMEFVPGIAPTLFRVRLKVGAASPFALPGGVRVFSNVDPTAAKEHVPTTSNARSYEFDLPNGLYVVTPDLADTAAPAKTFFVRGTAIEEEI